MGDGIVRNFRIFQKAIFREKFNNRGVFLLMFLMEIRRLMVIVKCFAYFLHAQTRTLKDQEAFLTSYLIVFLNGSMCLYLNLARIRWSEVEVNNERAKLIRDNVLVFGIVFYFIVIVY